MSSIKNFPTTPLPSVTIVSALAFNLAMLAPQRSLARPDFDVHPRNIERRIDFPPFRDTLIVDNEDGNEDLIWGLDVVFHDEVEPWISVDPDTGLIRPRGRMIVVAQIDSGDLDAGHYFADLVFNSNDPTRREFIVPVAGHTDVYPVIALNWPQNWGEWWGIDLNRVFQNIEWGRSYSFNRNVENPGFAPLEVQEINSDNGYFSIAPQEFNVDARGNRQVTFTFDADEVGVHSTTITSVSSAWDPRELSFRIVATVSPVFRRGGALPDTTINEDAAEFLFTDLDTIFLSSDLGVEFAFPGLVGLIPRVTRSHELFIAPRRNWHGLSIAIITATVFDSTLADTFQVTVNPLPDPPDPFDLIYPNDGDTLRWDSSDTLLVWQTARDPDGLLVYYHLSATPEGDDSTYIWADLGDTSFAWSLVVEDLLDGEIGGGFSWTVTADNGDLRRDAWSTFHHYVVSLSAPAAESRPPRGFEMIRAHPNPFNDALTISVSLHKPGAVSIGIYDVAGRRLYEDQNDAAASAERRFIWRPAGLGSGIYFARIEVNGTAVWQPVVLLR